MNKILKKILSHIEIQPIELEGNLIEQTNHFKFIQSKLTEISGEPTYKSNFAIKLIVAQLVREDNYCLVDFSRYKDDLKKLLASLTESEMSDLLSYYFGGTDQRKYKIIEKIEYLISNNEQINVNFIIDVLSNTIADELNYEILQVKQKLQKHISNKEWYAFYEINKDYSTEEYEYQIERINDILEGVLK